MVLIRRIPSAIPFIRYINVAGFSPVGNMTYDQLGFRITIIFPGLCGI